jgi:hypothetical protein
MQKSFNADVNITYSICLIQRSDHVSYILWIHILKFVIHCQLVIQESVQKREVQVKNLLLHLTDFNKVVLKLISAIVSIYVKTTLRPPYTHTLTHKITSY